MAVEAPPLNPRKTSPRTNHRVSGKAVALAIGGGGLLTVAGVAGYEALQNFNGTGLPEASAPAGIIIKGETPKPIDTANPTLVLPSNSPVQSENTAATPNPSENLSVIEQRLNDWVDGKIQVLDSKKFKAGGKPAILNIIDSKPQPDVWNPAYQGYLLGTQVIDNHLIAYVGNQDKAGNNYYIPLNMGELNKGFVGIINNDPNRLIFPTQQTSPNIVPLEKLETTMANSLTNDTIVYVMTPFKPAGDLSPRISKADYLAQIELARQFSLMSIEMASTTSYNDPSLAEKYPLGQALLNKQITSFNASEVPYVVQFWTP